MLIKRSLKTLIIVIVVLVLSAATYAFAAANTLPAATYAGDGNVAISGVTVSAVKYTVTYTANPSTTYIAGVNLTLSSAIPGTTIVKVKVLASSNTWYTCTHTSTTVMDCDVSAGNTTVTLADNLRVIVVDE